MTHSLQDIVALALREDVGPGDLTSRSIIPEGLAGRANLKARQALVLSGLPAVSGLPATSAGLSALSTLSTLSGDSFLSFVSIE